MRKVVSPRTTASSTDNAKRTLWAGWLETLEERRLLAATPALYTLSDPGPRIPASVRSAKVLGPAAPTSDLSALTAAALTQTYSGALSGKIVFTSPGHGWQWNTTLGRYATDRPEYWRQNDGTDGNLVEDFGTQDGVTLYADYVLRAGGTVVPMRPIGRQTNEVVLDNDSPGVTFTGSWSNSSSTRYYDEDYGAAADAVPYRYAATTATGETASATYTPNIPQSGFYPVYTWVLRGTDRVSQLYRINHTGGTTEVRVDHSKVGSGWVYLGTYHFNQGSAGAVGSVEISNNGTTNGPPNSKVVIADAIRFGNGMGDWIEPGAPAISGKPREDENSEHWIARMLGVGTTAAQVGLTDNVNGPSNMAQWMFSGTFGDAVYIGLHTNGSTGDVDTATGRGARADRHRRLRSYATPVGSGAVPRPTDQPGHAGAQRRVRIQLDHRQHEHGQRPVRGTEPGRLGGDGRDHHRGRVPRQPSGQRHPPRSAGTRSDRAIDATRHDRILSRPRQPGQHHQPAHCTQYSSRREQQQRRDHGELGRGRVHARRRLRGGRDRL
jgi:hypothetical protein